MIPFRLWSPGKTLSVSLLSIIIGSAGGSLTLYDQEIAADEGGAGPFPVAKNTSAVVLNGSNSSAFNFGTTSGAATCEFIVEGDPVAGGRDGFSGGRCECDQQPSLRAMG